MIFDVAAHVAGLQPSARRLYWRERCGNLSKSLTFQNNSKELNYIYGN